MKICILVAFMLITALPAAAQDDNQPWKKQINLDAGLLFPGGDQASTLDLNNGWGAAITFYYQLLSRHTFVSISAAYNQFPYGANTAYAETVIPVLLGARYNFSLTGFQPYLGFEFGVYLRTYDSYGGSPTIEESDVDFGVMPKVGFRFPIAGGLDFDGSLKWHNIIDDVGGLSWIGLNAGIAYTID